MFLRSQILFLKSVKKHFPMIFGSDFLDLKKSKFEVVIHGRGSFKPNSENRRAHARILGLNKKASWTVIWSIWPDRFMDLRCLFLYIITITTVQCSDFFTFRETKNTSEFFSAKNYRFRDEFMMLSLFLARRRRIFLVFCVWTTIFPLIFMHLWENFLKSTKKILWQRKIS